MRERATIASAMSRSLRAPPGNLRVAVAVLEQAEAAEDALSDRLDRLAVARHQRRSRT
jgi:hypothetical protein